MARHIEAGAFVPVNIQSDGAFGVLVRVGEPVQLTEREARYLFLTSQLRHARPPAPSLE